MNIICNVVRAGRFNATHTAARQLLLALGIALACGQASAQTSDSGQAPHGKQLYALQCALCHGPQGQGGQGPALGGIVNGAVAKGDFSYSAALRTLGGHWNPQRLASFLANPQSMAPGTSMPVQVTSEQDRADIIAFLDTLPAPNRQTTAASSSSAASAPGVFGGWREDAPGRMYLITSADLPAPLPDSSVSNGSKVVDRPANAWPKVPKGFTVSIFAKGLDAPRKLITAPTGDIFVAETNRGRVMVLRPDGSGKKSAHSTVFAGDLDEPFGMVLVPAGAHPKWLYVAETNRIVRYAYTPGASAPSGKPEVIVAQISPSTGGHSNRDMALSRDGQRLFVGVGSASNVADGMPHKSVEQAEAYDATHGLGAAWGAEENRAQVRAYSLDGKTDQNYATGIRNCSGITVQPATGEVWCSVNERDRLGNNLVPDYITPVPKGAFFGWPWWYIGNHQDPRLAGQRPDLKGRITIPSVLLQAHSASLGITFAPEANLPADWKGSAFAAEHGSWNRAERTGPKLIRVPVDAQGKPTGSYQDVMTGFVIDNQRVWGRLVDVTPARDGALLVSDDAGGVIWRVAYEGK